MLKELSKAQGTSMTLTEKCVVFLDILGFRSKVKEAGKCATKAVQLESSLEKVHNLGGGRILMKAQ